MTGNSSQPGTSRALLEGQGERGTKSLPKHLDGKKLVHATYRDHVHFHRTSPLAMSPQVRECVGWLVNDSAEYVVVCWDRDASPPTLTGGDPKASGLVILRKDILELRKVGSD